MNEKIKVNVSLSVYNILKKDMELFEFYKQDFKLNKNLFYVTLITNYYELFNEQEKERTHLIKKYLKDNSNMSDSHLNQISIELSKKLGEMKAYDEDEKYDIALSIKPTKASLGAITYIENYLLNNISLSNFYRNLFSSYARLPQDLREQIIFKPAYDKIQQAIKEDKKLFVVSTSNKPSEISPYTLAKSKEELFNYLLCTNDTGKPITFRLSRLKDITILNDQRNIGESKKELLNKMIEMGPQYSITTLNQEPILIKLTDNGIQQFKTSYVNRPEPVKIENNIYTFNCSYSQIHQYFRRFGSNATILQPKELQNRLKQFYKQGFYHYKNLEDKNNIQETT